MSDEEMGSHELNDESVRLKQKRDALTRENELLKHYLRQRQVESASTCEQLKSEIEMQIEHFESNGDASEAHHLETLRAFHAEIEAIQLWNSKIRNKYFSRNSNENNHDDGDDDTRIIGAIINKYTDGTDGDGVKDNGDIKRNDEGHDKSDNPKDESADKKSISVESNNKKKIGKNNNKPKDANLVPSSSSSSSSVSSASELSRTIVTRSKRKAETNDNAASDGKNTKRKKR